MRECLFCGSDGPFTTVEHVIPESLGNDEDVLEGAVCDACQAYFAHSVEKPCLEHTPIAFWRTLLGIESKKGRLPSVTLGKAPRGKLPSRHPSGDMFTLTAHPDGSTSVDDLSGRLTESVQHPDRRRAHLVLTPWHLSILGRFLGKVGLEYLCKADATRALSSEFDAIRTFVRRGSSSELWPLYVAQSGTIQGLSGEPRVTAEGPEVDVLLYQYSLVETRHGDHLFALRIGTDIYMVCLTHRRPERHLEGVVHGTKLECVWYEDGTW